MKTDTHSTQLDNIAYYNYCKINKDFMLPSKLYFISHKNSYKNHYIKANNQIRKQKLLNLNQTR